MNKEKKLIIYGNGDTSELAYYYFEKYTEYKVEAFTCDSDYIDEEERFSLPIVPFEDVKEIYPPESFYIFIALGFIGINQTRSKKFLEAKVLGYSFASFIHPTVSNESLSVGENCFIYENVVLQAYSVIEDNVVIAPMSLVGHHVLIKDSVFIASSVTIQGRVEIDKNSFIGPCVNIMPRIKIGKNNIILFDTIIRKDTIDDRLYYTEEAKIVSTNVRYAQILKEF